MNCPGCNAKPGSMHYGGCDVERCYSCGYQLISCSCKEELVHDNRMSWTGKWPGIAECEEFGLWAKMVPGKGWTPCDKDDEGASPDLNTLVSKYRWDRAKHKFV